MENLSPSSTLDLDHRGEELEDDPPGILITEQCQKVELNDSKIDLIIKNDKQVESDIKTEESQDDDDEDEQQTVTADLMTLKTTIKIKKPFAINPSNGGKPMMSTINKKTPRGRPKKRKALTAMYQSQISDTLGIKLCIKKSETPQKTKSNKKRSRRTKVKDSDDSDCDRKRRRETIKQKANNNTDKQKKYTETVEPVEQSVWGKNIPENCLYQVCDL